MVNELLICLNILLNIGKIGHFLNPILDTQLQNAAIGKQFSPKQVQWRRQEIRTEHELIDENLMLYENESPKQKTNKGKQE